MINLNWFSFLLGIGCLIPIYFIVYVFYRYFDLKYFSSLEINQLKEENKYLKEENKKVSGASANFWSNE